MTELRQRKAVRALPVLLAVLLALGLLGADRTGTGQVAGHRPARAGMVVLVASPSDADAVVGVRPFRHLPVRTLRLGLFEVGVLATAAFPARRVARWLPAQPPETLPDAAGLAVRRGRAPPPVSADGVHAREATGR